MSKKLKRIVLTEWQDARMLRAAEISVRKKTARPVFIGDIETIRKHAKLHNVLLENIELRDTRYSPEQLQIFMHKFPASKKISEEQAKELIGDPLYRSALELDAGDVEGMVAGIQRSTADVVRAALRVIGLQPSCKTASSFFLVSFSHPLHPIHIDCIMADCALVIEPTASQLADIAVASADNARQFLSEKPRVAMLSFSTAGSAAHQQVSKVQQATQLVRERRPDIMVTGDIQADAALVPEIAAIKMPGANWTAPANVLVFPNLHAGNIAYKLCQRLGGARVIGPILQGFCKPINDVSRGASEEEIANVIALTAKQAQ